MDEVDSIDFVVAGWVAGATAEIPLSVVVGGRTMSHFIVGRPDVRASFPQFAFSTGFGVKGNLAEINHTEDLTIEITFGDDRISANFRISRDALDASGRESRLKRDARVWCVRHLRCPVCRTSSRRLNFEYHCITCLDCGEHYLQSTTALNLLTEGLRVRGNVVPSNNVSANPYDPLAQSLIAETAANNGWILDCGAGSRECRQERVINLEIVDYPSTDVMSIGEALPFEDNVFDAILSLAVLEHVRDPFSCAREMVRVAKPGAKIICSAPFLQPVHGYPSHYYNMTQQGLVNLFSEDTEILDCHVPLHGHPIYAVQWLAREYLAGLPKAEREEFSAYTIGEIAAIAPQALLGVPIAALLSPKAQEIIACLNTIVVMKRP